MKRIGIIGGMSFESTLHYYDRINRQVNERAGELTSADLLLRSVNFEEYRQLMKVGSWKKIADKLRREAFDLVEKNGCDFVAIATNTMHKVADQISSYEIVDNSYGRARIERVKLPLIHIGDCVAEECHERNFKRVALIGTKATMTGDFMKERLRQNGLEVVDTFTKSEIAKLDQIIFDELCHGEVKLESQEAMLNMIVRADTRDMDNGGTGIDAVILGCTELEMLTGDKMEFLIKSKYKHHFEFVNSTQAHINKIVDLCLS